MDRMQPTSLRSEIADGAALRAQLGSENILGIVERLAIALSPTSATQVKNTDPRLTTARKLEAIADELARGASYPITRLTVLKRLCAEWETAARFACYLAELAQDRFRIAPTAHLEPGRREAFGDRIGAAVACIHRYLAAPDRDADLALRAARRELQAAQSEFRDMRWATVRNIHSFDALVVEHATQCILDPRNCAAWGYELGSAYAKRYDLRHGSGLVPESAPRVREIAAFWRSLPPTATYPV